MDSEGFEERKKREWQENNRNRKPKERKPRIVQNMGTKLKGILNPKSKISP